MQLSLNKNIFVIPSPFKLFRQKKFKNIQLVFDTYAIIHTDARKILEIQRNYEKTEHWL